MDLGDRRRVEGIAGEAVETIGGEDGDATGGDAAFERLARDLRLAALQPDRARSCRFPHPAEDDPLDPGQVAPGLDRAEPGLPHQRPDRLGLPLTNLHSERGRSLFRIAVQMTGALRNEGAIGIEAVGAGERAPRAAPIE